MRCHRRTIDTYPKVSRKEGSNRRRVVYPVLYEGDKVVLEMEASGGETGRNIYGDNTLLSRTASSTTLYYLYNGHGDITALVNSDDSVAAQTATATATGVEAGAAAAVKQATALPPASKTTCRSNRFQHQRAVTTR
jgi:hypothetical protein